MGRNPGQPGQPGGGKGILNAGQTGRNLSQSGNIDTSKIAKQGSQYRWSANKNPYSGLNRGKGTYNNPGSATNGANNNTGSAANGAYNNPGRAANGANNNPGSGRQHNNASESGIRDMSGFVFPSDFSPHSDDGQNMNRPQ